MGRSRIFIAVISLLMLCACSDRPEQVISDKKMVKIMADMQITEAYLQSGTSYNGNPEYRERVMEDVLRKNHVTHEEFDSTISWYGRHMDVYDELFSKVDKELGKRAKNVSGPIEEVNLNDIWPYSRHLTITPLSSSQGIVFNFEAPDISKGDKLIWKLKSSSTIDGSALLGVRYSDGTSAYYQRGIGTPVMEVSVQTDTALTVKEIFGNLRLSDPTARLSVDSISLKAIPLDTLAYNSLFSQRKFMGPRRKVIKKTVENDSVKSEKSEATKRDSRPNNDVLQLIQ